MTKLKQLKKGISDYLSVLEILNFNNSKKLDIENVKHFLKLINEIEEEEKDKKMTKLQQLESLYNKFVYA